MTHGSIAVLSARDVRFDPRTDEFHADPYGTYARLRAVDPVHRSIFNAWVLTRHKDVCAVLRAHDRFTSQPPPDVRSAMERTFPPRLMEFRDCMLFQDPPVHARLRELVGNGLGGRRFAELAALVSAAFEDHLSLPQAAVGHDATALTFALPNRLLAALLGVPAADLPRLAQWTAVLARVAELPVKAADLAAADDAHGELSDYFGALCALRRRRPANDLISEMVARQEADPDRYSAGDVTRMAVLLIFAGNGTVGNLLTNALYLLATNADQTSRLLANPSLVESAVEEILRFESPLQIGAAGGYWARTAVDIRGRRLAVGDRIIALLGAANRDPAQFDEPDTFDIGRRPNRHVAFGYGVHFCLGAGLARTAARAALAAVVTGRRRPVLTGAVRWRRVFAARALDRLPIAFVPADR